MHRFLIIFAILFSLSLTANAAKKIVVTEQNVSVSAKAEQTMYYQFLAGDKVIVNLESKKDRDDDFILKVEEITKSGSVVRFSSEHTAKIKNKEFKINATAPYKFTISTEGGRGSDECDFKIERVPAADSFFNFNTADLFFLVTDTVWVEESLDSLTGYSESKVLRNKMIRDTVYQPILNKSYKLGSLANTITHFQGRSVVVPFSIPYTEEAKLPDGSIKKTLMSWTYWIGAGQEARKAYEIENKAAIAVVGAVASYFLADYAALINGALTLLNDKNSGDNIKYSLGRVVKQDSVVNFDEGNVTSVAAQVNRSAELKANSYQLTLYNDNYVSSVDADVRILAKYEEVKNVKFTETVKKPLYQKVVHRTPKIELKKQPFLP